MDTVPGGKRGAEAACGGGSKDRILPETVNRQNVQLSCGKSGALDWSAGSAAGQEGDGGNTS